MKEFTLSQNEQLVMLPGPVGQLEAMIGGPAPDQSRDTLAIICHPHSLFGGTMGNKVVYMVAKMLRSLGCVTIRFNFRGVEKSAGTYDNGIGETEDLLAVFNWAKQNLKLNHYWLGGFSFGSYVALRAANQWPIEKLMSIAPPVTNFPMAELPRPPCPWIIVQGDEDEVIEADKVFEWVKTIQPAPILIHMKGASHFFHGRLIELTDLLSKALLSS